jgi:hypothetical protein
MTGIDIEREAVPTDDELEEMVYGPKSAPFVSEAQHLLVVGSVNVDDFIPRLPDIYYYLGDEDKNYR